MPTFEAPRRPTVIPPLDAATGKLPFAAEDQPYVATLNEVHQRYVKDAPEPARRGVIWRAFQVWHELAQTVAPGSRYWISGSFLTEKARPSDLDVILVWDEAHLDAFHPELSQDARVLLSHLTVSAVQPAGTVDKLQPMGGLIDGFYAPSWIPEHTAVWQQRWSTEYDKTTRQPTGVRMGYLEVTP